MSFRFSYRLYRRKFCKPLQTARGEWAVREGYILKKQGAGVGFGEIAPIPEFGTETLAEAGAFLERLVDEPALAQDPGALAALPCCAFGLSAAQRSLSVPARPFELAALLPAGVEALAMARSKVVLGYTTFKWKVGVFGVEKELHILKDLISELPAGAKFRLDANASLNEAELIKWMKALQPFREQLDYFEQPLPVGTEARLQCLSQEFDLPIALDESLNGLSGLRWLEPGAWNGPLVVKPLLMGDVDQLIARLLPVAPQITLSSAFETGVGLSHALSLAEVLTGMVFPLGFDTSRSFDDKLGAGPVPAGSSITVAEHHHMESIWKQLPHSN